MRALVAAACLVACTAHAVPIAGQGTWESMLQARDLDGNGTTDAYYDTQRNVTWLADANYAYSSGYVDADHSLYHWAPGSMLPPDIHAFANSVQAFGIGGWRLPHAVNWAPPDCNGGYALNGNYCGFVPPAGYNELSDLFTKTLGNGAGKPFNTGDFVNFFPDQFFLMEDDYAGFLSGGGPLPIYFLAYGDGMEFVAYEIPPLYAWLVHDSDIAPVPEPETYALMLIGLVAIASSRGWAKL